MHISHIMLIGAMLLSASEPDITTNETSIARGHVLSAKTQAEIQAARHWFSCPEISVPDMTIPETNRIAISAVPRNTLEGSAHWIREVVREEWLPKDLTNSLNAVKDLVVIEARRDLKFGGWYPPWIEDYILADYAIDSHEIHIQEDGIAVSVRVDLPEKKNIARNPEGFVRECFGRYLRVSGEQLKTMSCDLKREGDLFYGTVCAKEEYENAMATRGDGMIITGWWWWHKMRICTNGEFFFVTAYEQDGSPYHVEPTGGPCNRF